jgi:hypothetical protein
MRVYPARDRGLEKPKTGPMPMFGLIVRPVLDLGADGTRRPEVGSRGGLLGSEGLPGLDARTARARIDFGRVRTMDQVFKIELPDDLADLAEVVIDGIDVSDCYGPDGKLTEAARRQIEAANEDLAKVETQMREGLAEREAKITKLQTTLRDLTITHALRSALIECGVPPKRIPMAPPFGEVMGTDHRDRWRRRGHGVRAERRRRGRWLVGDRRGKCLSAEAAERPWPVLNRAAEVDALMFSPTPARGGPHTSVMRLRAGGRRVLVAVAPALRAARFSSVGR